MPRCLWSAAHSGRSRSVAERYHARPEADHESQGAPIEPVAVVAVTVWAVSFALVAARIATARYRRPLTWAAFGAILGPIAIGLLVAAPPGRCGICLADVVGWRFRCPRCGSDVRSRPAISSALDSRQTGRSETQPRTATVDVRRPRRRRGTAPDPAAAPEPLPQKPAPVRPSQNGNRALAERDTHASSPATDTPPQSGMGTGPAATAVAVTQPAVGSAPTPPTAAPAESLSTPGSAQPRILASGVFAGGMPRLVIGSRYLIAINGSTLEIMGPVDTAPSHVAVAHDLRDIEVSGIADRFLLTAADPSRLALGFIAVLGQPVASLEAELARARDAANDGTRIR